MKRNALTIAIAAALAAPFAAHATDGYFSHGYGMKAKGRGGVSTAMTGDAFGGASNPATMAWAGDRLDVGLDWFSPKRSASRTGSTGGMLGMDGSATSGSNNFLVPEFAYNKMLRPNLALGVTVYGNGGMNTDYPGGQIAASAANACGAPAPNGFNPGGAAAGPFNLLCGSGKLGIDMMQLIVAPTVAYKLNDKHSIGVSPLFGYQRFKAEGLQGFVGFTPNPAGWPANNALTNRGYDSSTGWGVRVGWLGKVSDSVTLGAGYSTRMRMKRFEKYQDLFAQRGDFDIPENYNVGIAFKATPSVTIAADYQRINVGDVRGPGNPSTNAGNAVAASNFTTGSLGCDNCRGFGWSNLNVFKLGVEYQYSQALTLRGGVNITDNPIGGRDVTFNIIAPGVVKNHVTAGFTYDLGGGSEITMAYMHAFRNSVTGQTLYANFIAGATATEKIEMSQNSLGIAYGLKFK